MAHNLSEEQLLASAVHYLFETGKKEYAFMLLSCRIGEIREENDDGLIDWIIILRGSPVFFKKYIERDPNYPEPHFLKNDLQSAIHEAFSAVLPPGLVEILAKSDIVDVDTDWRARLLAEAETGEITNQNPYRKEPLIWKGMKFNNEAEIKIAQALDSNGVMFFPMCLARVGAPGNRNSLITDFLICYRSKWGILKVDDPKYDAADNATTDLSQRYIFEQPSGIAYFDSFPNSRCISEPDQVIQEFLSILVNKNN